VPAGELERWARENDPIDRYVLQLLDNSWVAARDLEDVDARVRAEIDAATDACVDEPPPVPESALPGVYVDPPAAPLHWYRSL
jgi:TPP-dependent pyruvate/acetoin dehydrogenase alpha subunit